MTASWPQVLILGLLFVGVLAVWLVPRRAYRYPKFSSLMYRVSTAALAIAAAAALLYGWAGAGLFWVLMAAAAAIGSGSAWKRQTALVSA